VRALCQAFQAPVAEAEVELADCYYVFASPRHVDANVLINGER
jgi:hypothetical protein